MRFIKKIKPNLDNGKVVDYTPVSEQVNPNQFVIKNNTA